MKAVLRKAVERAESALDRSFCAAWNPAYHLGALGWFFYWVVAVSGVYLYVFFDSGTTQAYESVEYLTHGQWYAGGVMRSLHRYASDAMVVVILAHLTREWIMDRLRGPRWFAWITGVPLLWLVFAAGVSGYWMVWDRLAQYVAVSATEWLDALPLFGTAIASNFLHEDTLSGRFFTLMMFIHIAVPLALLFSMWLHIQRLSQPKVTPPRGLALGSLAALMVMSLWRPALSQGPANLERVPSPVGLDWFYLFAFPIQDHLGGPLLWLLALGGTFALLVLPWLPPLRPKPAAARVDLANCNGCGRCVADCPYGAVKLSPRSDGAPFREEALVSPDLCVACGLCVGACPTATPFRRRTALVAGIELPDLSTVDLMQRSLAAVQALGGGAPRVIAYACGHGAAAGGVPGSGVATVILPCVGMLPPPFVDLMLSRGHADGVLLVGCREGDCHYRLGQRWSTERIAGARDPYLRARVPRQKLRCLWLGVDQGNEMKERSAAFRAELVLVGAPTAEEAQSP